jgi:hypothetical protein
MTAIEQDQGKWKAVSKRLLSEIEAGRWKPGEQLPGSAWLCEHLGVTAPTLRKAVLPLVTEGWLDALARGWRVHRDPDRTRGLRVALVRCCDEDGNMVGEAVREAFFRRALEQESARTGMRISIWGISPQGVLFVGGKAYDGEISAQVDGLVLSLWRIERPETAFSRLSGIRIPLAIWDERPQGGAKPAFQRCRWFTSGYSQTPGKTVSRHLLDQGHEGIAYISPFHGSQWSRHRLEGIAASMPRNARLRSFTVDSLDDPSQRNPQPEEVAILMAPLLERMDGGFPGRVAALAESMEALLRDQAVLGEIDVLCAAALEDRTLTAWVAANDDIALLVSSWLASRGLEIGKDIALAGFDNTLRSQEAGLTSYGFAEDELAVAMLAYVAEPKRWRTGGTVGVEGILMVRPSTTEPVRKRA